MILHRTLIIATVLFAAVARLPAQQAAPTIVVLVRHAEKATSPGNDAGLTEAGRARADALADALHDARVDAVITSQYERTRMTAEPIAAARHLTPLVVQAGPRRWPTSRRWL